MAKGAPTLAAVYSPKARARRIEAEGDDRLAGLLVEGGLAVHEVVAGHHGRLLEDVEHALLVERGQDLLPGLDPLLGAVGAAHHGLEGQPRGGADQVLQLLRRADARDLDQDAVRHPGAGSWAPACRPRRHGGARSRPIAAWSGRRWHRTLGGAERHDQRVALAAHVERGGSHARQADNRLGQRAHGRNGLRQPFGLAHAHVQLSRRRIDAADRADSVAQVPQFVPHLGPERVHPRLVDIRDPHLGQKMRAAAQVETEVHQRRGQEVRPARQRLGIGLRRDAGRLDRGCGVIVALDPLVEEIWHRERQPVRITRTIRMRFQSGICSMAREASGQD
jgi:hypothetical protein